MGSRKEIIITLFLAISAINGLPSCDEVYRNVTRNRLGCDDASNVFCGFTATLEDIQKVKQF